MGGGTGGGASINWKDGKREKYINNCMSQHLQVLRAEEE